MFNTVHAFTKFSICTVLCLFIAACGPSEQEVAEASLPEEIAVAFFDALYNQKDLNIAVKHVTPKASRVMLHYKTASAVQRHILNMKFDQVTIVVDKDPTGALLGENAKKATITLMFDGQYDGKIIRDMKTVKMVKQKNVWKLDEIKADPYG